MSQASQPDDRRDVEIAAVATAVPGPGMAQEDAAARARRIFPHLAGREGLFANTGVARRHTAMAPEWYEQSHGWRERSALFECHALMLLEEVARQTVAAAGVEFADIDVLVTQTVTGIAVPTLEAHLMNRLPFAASVERVPLFGLGCAGGAGVLARAARLAEAPPGRVVLALTVELCTLCFRPGDDSVRNFVSTALFGDGAAGLLLRGGGSASRDSASPPLACVRATGEHLWPDSIHLMGWSVEDDGFGIVLSTELPEFLRDRLRPAAEAFLASHGVDFADLDGYLLHPGGARIMEAVEGALSLSGPELEHSRAVLRDYGNMSSATVLFVLERAVRSGARGLHLLAAFGPGFTASFALVDL